MPTRRQRQPTRPQWWRHQWPAWTPRRPTRPSGTSPPLRPDVQAPRPIQPSELQPRAAGCCRKKQSAATNRASTGSTTAATRHGGPPVGWGRSTQTQDAKGRTQRERGWWQRRRREWRAKEPERQQQRQREDVGRATGSSWTPQTQKRPSVARAWRRRGGKTFHKLMHTPYADQRRRLKTGLQKAARDKQGGRWGGTHGQCGRRCRCDRMRGGARARRSWTERRARCTGGERGGACAHGKGAERSGTPPQLGRRGWGPTIWGGANAARLGAPRDRAGPAQSGPRDSRDTGTTTTGAHPSCPRRQGRWWSPPPGFTRREGR